jgi:Uma2 family endonuclease
MAIPLLKDIPLAPPSDLGPFRRQDYEALPEEPRCELIYGRFYLSPSPSLLHQTVVLALASTLRQIARRMRALVAVAPLDVSFFDHSVTQPDVIYVTTARRQILEKRVEGAPDLIVEVLSPGTARRDRGEKLMLYAEGGVCEYWIVDATERQIEFLRNDSGRFVVALPVSGVYRSQALPGLSLDIAAFWQEVEEDLRILDLEEA